MVLHLPLRPLLLTCLSVAAASPFASAVSLSVLNPSFEANNGVGSFPPPSNWTSTGGLFTESNTGVGFTTNLSGTRYSGIDNATVFQDLGVVFQPNSTYTITLSVGNRPSFAEGITQFALQSSTGGVDLGTATSVNNDLAVPEGAFVDFTYTYTTGAVAPAGNVVAIWRGVDDGAGGGNPSRADVDNYRVSVVPEPSCLGLVGVGVLGLLIRRRAKARLA